MQPNASSLRLPDDPLKARALDIGRFLNRSGEPPSIKQVAEDDDILWGSSARSLCAIVGSEDALEELRAEPHVDDSFDWTGISGHGESLVRALLDLIERPSPAGAGNGDTIWERVGIADAGMPWVDDEYRTILWRILRLLALHPDRPLERRCKPDRLAAAIVWVALDASEGFGNRRRRWKARDLWAWFGVSSCIKIGRALAESLAQLHLSTEQINQLSPHRLHSEQTLVGTASLLHSRYRTQLIDERTQLKQMITDQFVRDQAEHPFHSQDGNVIKLRSRPATVRWASKGATDEGRSSILVALGEDLDDLEMLALSVTDARRLVSVVEYALNESP